MEDIMMPRVKSNSALGKENAVHKDCQRKTRATNSKIGPVDLSKNEKD